MNKTSKKDRLIMGIDPGTNFTGYGFLHVEENAISCLDIGYINLCKLGDPYAKLRQIFLEVTWLIGQHAPDEVALESPFFGENVQSMLKLGRAQGVAMAAALVKGLPVHEYAPRLIKQSITGSGRASKEQVAAMLKSMLNIEYDLKNLDATDGLAVALCHYFQSGSPLAIKPTARPTRSKSVSWGDFVDSNPDRVIKNVKKK